MNSGLQRRVNGALVLSGLLGLALTAFLVPTVVGFALGKPMLGLTFSWDHLPLWLLQMNLPMGNVGWTTLAVLCVLLLVAGKWPGRVAALLGAGWVLTFLVISQPHGYWTNWIAVYNMRPIVAFTSVHAVVMLLLSVFALREAARLRREARGQTDGREPESP